MVYKYLNMSKEELNEAVTTLLNACYGQPKIPGETNSLHFKLSILIHSLHVSLEKHLQLKAKNRERKIEMQKKDADKEENEDKDLKRRIGTTIDENGGEGEGDNDELPDVEEDVEEDDEEDDEEEYEEDDEEDEYEEDDENEEGVAEQINNDDGGEISSRNVISHKRKRGRQPKSQELPDNTQVS